MSPGAGPNADAFAAAQALIVDAANVVVTEAANTLLNLMRTAPTYRQRGELAAAQTQLLQKREPLLREFRTALRDKVASELDPSTGPQSRDGSTTDWAAVSLVDEEQIEERLSAERVGQLINHDCEAELRELTPYTSTLLKHGWADPDRNPLRGNVVGHALHRAIEMVIEDPEVERTLLREIGAPLAKALPACYRTIIEDFARRGFGTAGMVVRSSVATTAQPQPRPPPTFEEARALWERSIEGRPLPESGAPPRTWESSILGRYGQFEPIPEDFDPQTSLALFDRLVRGSLPSSLSGASGDPARAAPTAEADAALTSLLRRLSGGLGDAPELPPLDGQRSEFGFASTVPANLIRRHRDELSRAAYGKLDHLVIEVVASLFDQILADARVVPQMARQIARLQLPVLRVALRDPSFFSSRRHAVRRFINRVSTLAVGFDSFDTDSGREFVQRVASLVDAIVDGDFDHLETYDAKLAELEGFVQQQARAEIDASPAAATLKAKELEWQQEREFGAQLRSALAPLAIPVYLKDFIAQVWSRVIVAVSLRDGEEAESTQRIRKGAFDLVVSVQPKRSLEQRSRFLSTLPGLMSTLNEGMRLIDWPEHDNTAFFGKLLAEHAGSLKTAPMSDLDYNLLLRGIEAAARTPLPTPADTVAAAEPETDSGPAIEPHFSAAEAEQLGLVVDNAVDWQARVPLSAEDLADSAALAAQDSPVPSGVGVGDTDPGEAPSLRDRLQLGVGYRLHLQDRWQRVRLTYMSPGRTMFLFGHGSGGRGTISMTARMLERLSDAGLLKAAEKTPLLERATARARTQLASAPGPASGTEARPG